MTCLSLFSGIGGLDLAAEWAGFETVGQCEWADYPTKVLEKHWPDVPRWRDIRTLTAEDFHERTGLRTVDVISGGFPCQPFSVAGKQKGKGDDRYLWPEMLRVIRELGPRWVVGENVPGILRIAAADVVKDLEREGYNVVVLDFEAAAVGAPHRRERIAFVGHAERCGQFGNDGRKPGQELAHGCADVAHVGHAEPHPESVRRGTWRPEPAGQQGESLSGDGGASYSHANGKGLQGRQRERVPERAGERIAGESGAFPANTEGKGREKRYSQRMGQAKRKQRPEQVCSQATGRGQPDGSAQWAVEPDVGRVANGVPARVDRLKCLGNAVVPQQFYPILLAIKIEIAREETMP